MKEIGIVVSSSSKREYEWISTSDYTTNVVEYTIIGISYIDLSTGDVVARTIDEFDSDYHRDDYPYILLNGTFSITKAYSKNGLSNYESYLLSNLRDNTSRNISHVLPVYTEGGSLLVSCNGNSFALYSEDDIYLVVDIKSNEVRVECWSGASKFRLSEIYRTTYLDFKDYVGVFKSDIDGVYTFSDICYVYSKHIEKVIPPEECRRLVVSPKSEIDTLVLNNNIGYLSLVNRNKVASIKTFYISKDISKYSLGYLLYYFIKNYLVNILDININWEISDFCKEVLHLNNIGDAYKIYDFCMKGRHKMFMNRIMSNHEIVVY